MCATTVLFIHSASLLVWGDFEFCPSGLKTTRSTTPHKDLQALKELDDSAWIAEGYPSMFAILKNKVVREEFANMSLQRLLKQHDHHAIPHLGGHHLRKPTLQKCIDMLNAEGKIHLMVSKRPRSWHCHAFRSTFKRRTFLWKEQNRPSYPSPI